LIFAQSDSCDPIVTFADGKAPMREVFISPTGNNSTGAGTRENPFQTIGRARQGAQPGDAIRLLPGTYPAGSYVENLAGTSDAPIWLGGVPGEERPLISGGNQALHLVRVRYLVVEHMEITGASQNGINCDDGGGYGDPDATRHVVFRELSFRDIGTGGNQDALKLSGVDDFFVLDCEFAGGSAGGSGIDHVGCHGGLIARCTFTDMGGNAIQCKGGSEDIEIRWNRFANAGMRAINIGGSTGFPFFRPPLSEDEPNVEARNIRVIANVFEGSDAPVAFVGTVDSLVANNTFIDPTRWILRILQETTSSAPYEFLACGDNRFVNNLVYFNRGQISTYVNIGSNTDAASFQFSNNLWYAHDQPAQSQPSLPSAETNGVTGEDPEFVDVAGRDYSIAVTGPAAGQGVGLEEVKADLRERCFADPPGIGALEANPPGVDTDGDGMPDDWEDANGLNKSDASDAALDSDGDGMTNLEEYIAGTDPRDAESVFALALEPFEGGEIAFRYAGRTGRRYRVQSRSAGEPGVWLELSSNAGSGGEVVFSEAADAVGGKVYRAVVELEP
jgi:hypothetical protein